MIIQTNPFTNVSRKIQMGRGLKVVARLCAASPYIDDDMSYLEMSYENLKKYLKHGRQSNTRRNRH